MSSSLRIPEDEASAVRIAAATVVGIDGAPVRMRDLWRTGPAVTAFLRHYGCLFCLQLVHDLLEAAPRILATGATVVLVGNGTVNQAKRFAADRRLPRPGFTVVTDPERQSFQAAELARGYTRTFNPDSVRAYGRARAEGHRILGVFGDLTQLGGILVTRPVAQPVFFHRSRFAGDHPGMDAVLDAIVRA